MSSPTSPCVRLCAIDPMTQTCSGCLRTLPEIAGWRGMSDDERLEVLAAVEERRVPGGSEVREPA